jgi:hypothetical protein
LANPEIAFLNMEMWKYGKLMQKRCVSRCVSPCTGREGGDGDGITPRTAEAREQEDLEASDHVMTFFDDVLTLDDFEQGALLGRGSFGRVVHVKHKDSGTRSSSVPTRNETKLTKKTQ